MRPSRRSLLQSPALWAAASLSGCANARIIGFDKARRSLDIANAGEPVSLDPHKISGGWENNIVGNMFVGLTTEDAHARPVPGMAQRWETSEDGLLWIFYLREAAWSDGEACDAHDFEFALRRILDPARLAVYAPLLYPIKNAAAVNRGERRLEDLGVYALDDRTLQIALEHPAPYLPQLLKHYTTFPVPKHRVTRFGEDWIKAENVAVNGAFTLRKWWSNYIIHLERNPRFYDAANVALEHLYFYPTADATVAARKIESGEGGWSTSFPSARAAELRRLTPGFVRVTPSLTTTYFAFNVTRPPFSDVRVRRALAMAYDRDFVAAQIFSTGERAAYAIVPPGVAAYTEGARYAWADTPIAERKREAERLLRQAGYGPNNPLRIEFAHRNAGKARVSQ